MYAQEKERMGILFPFPGFPEKKGNKDGKQETRKPGVYGICGHIPENVISLFYAQAEREIKWE